MKKVLLVVTKQFGSSIDYLSYCKYLKKFYTITVISTFQNKPKITPEKFDILYVEQKSGSIRTLLFFTYTCIKTIRAGNFDIVIVSYFKLAFFLKLFAPKQKMILDIRSGEISKNPLRVKLLNFLIFFNSLFFRKITIISSSLRKKLFLKSSKTAIIPAGGNMINNNKIFDCMRLLYVGTLNFRNVHETIEGLKIFLEQQKNTVKISYDIVGWGDIETENKLKNAIALASLQKYVSFHGRKSHEEVIEFFKSSNIGISYIPIKNYFNCQPPNKTFEYILAGMPCVATATNENKKVICDVNGILCMDNPKDFARALREISLKLISYDSNLIQSTLPNYTWENIVLNVLNPFINNYN